MTEPRPDDVVHQAFFGWSYEAGKLALISHSFLRTEDATRWLRRLEPHLRLQPVPGTELPPQALSCLYYKDGFVAVLRRVKAGDSPGRNNSHALIGPAASLGTPIALGLSKWSGWRDNPPSGGVETIPATYFLPAGAAAAEQLQPLAERREHEMGVVLARLLDHPRDPLSIIGCPDEDRLAMVWGLHEAADDYLRQRGWNRLWSFSTYEDRHADSIVGLPEVVFLPAKPQGVEVAHRTIVQLGPESAVVGQNGTLASHLVANLLRGTPLPAGEPMREVVSAQSGSRTPVPGPGYQASAPYESADPSGAQLGHPTQNYQVGQAEHSTQLLAELLNARSVRKFSAQLGRLEQATRQPYERKKLRDALDVGAVNTVAELTESAANQFIERFLVVAYGPNLDDLRDPDARKHAAKLVKGTQSEQFARMVGMAAAKVGAQEIFAAAFDRWSAGGHPAGLVPTGRTAQIARWARRSRRLPIVTAVAAVAVLTAVFLLGFLAGQPEQVPGDTAAGNGTATSSSTPAASDAPEPNSSTTEPSSSTLPTIGQAENLEPKQDQQVFSFVQVGDSYYPQALCVSIGNKLWQCTRHGTPPDPSQPASVSLLAMLVPKDQVSELVALARDDWPMVKRREWTDPITVRPL
jgi:hypothetical protein